MPGSSHILTITVYDTDGTTAKEAVTVTIRNESTSETQSGDTDVSGEVALNLSGFTSGWTVGDTISYYVNYSGYEAEGSYTSTTDATASKSLTLVAVPTANSLRYFDVKDFLDTFNLVQYDNDTENGIRPESIILVGQAIEAEIDELLNQKFDNNSSSYHSVTNEYHDADAEQQTWYLKKLPVVAITKVEVNKATPSSKENWWNLAYAQLDACDATTSWSASTDGAVTLNTTNAEFNEGSGCLNITKTGATQTSVTFSKAITSTDFTGRTFKLDFYVEDLTELKATGSTAVEIRIGSDSSNYYSKTFDQSLLAESSWNTLSLAYNSSDDAAGATGSPDVDAIDYVAIVITYAASSTTVTAGDMRLDNIRLNDIEDVNIRYNMGRVNIAEDVDHPELGENQIRFTYTYGISSVPSDIQRLAILMTGKGFAGQMLQRLNIDTTEATGLNSAIQNLTNMNDEINRIIENRRIPELRGI